MGNRIIDDLVRLTDSISATPNINLVPSEKAVSLFSNPLSVFAAGTAYALTSTPAALDFGTTDPALTITKAGKYLLLARAQLFYNGATFAASRTVTLKLRRTNNTAADLTNGSATASTGIVTTITSAFLDITWAPDFYTTTNTDDIISMFGDISVVPTAGSLDAVAASIHAIRIA